MVALPFAGGFTPSPMGTQLRTRAECWHRAFSRTGCCKQGIFGRLDPSGEGVRTCVPPPVARTPLRTCDPGCPWGLYLWKKQYLSRLVAFAGVGGTHPANWGYAAATSRAYAYAREGRGLPSVPRPAGAGRDEAACCRLYRLRMPGRSVAGIGPLGCDPAPGWVRDG